MPVSTANIAPKKITLLLWVKIWEEPLKEVKTRHSWWEYDGIYGLKPGIISSD